ncbi:MAG TPA: radical SAM protein [Burkholderiales bacterium]
MRAAAAIKFAQIEPVGQCNLRCRMCPVQFRADGPPHGPLAFMAFDTFRRLLDEMPALEELHLQGLGEPLMHPRFFEMVRLAHARGVRVSTNTNLTLLSRRRARECVESGLAELHASLDGAHAETFERIRRRARFDKVTRHLRELLEVRRALGAATPRVRLVMVAMRDNLHELPDVVELAAELGIGELFVQHLCHDFGEESLPVVYAPMRRFVDEQSLLHEDVARIETCFGRARERAAACGLDLRLPRTRPVAGSKVGRCGWPWRGPYISYTGDAMPCCMVATPDRANLGNMAEHGVAAVWGGERYGAFRAALASDSPPAVCRSCAVYNGVF